MGHFKRVLQRYYDGEKGLIPPAKVCGRPDNGDIRTIAGEPGLRESPQSFLTGCRPNVTRNGGQYAAGDFRLRVTGGQVAVHLRLTRSPWLDRQFVESPILRGDRRP